MHDWAGLRPGGTVTGTFRPEGSKSHAQRALLCAALARGSTRIAGLPAADDVRAARALVEACGAEVEELTPASVRVHGLPPGRLAPREPVSFGESGTLARLATAALALCGRPGTSIETRAEGSLARRDSPALFEALARAGVAVEREGFRARITPLGPPSTLRLVRPTSSQEVSGLLIALAAYPDPIRLEVEGTIPSRPYLDMTVRMLALFGAKVEESEGTFDVRGPLVAPGDPITVEPDASAAAVALAAACLSGGSLTVTGLGRDSLQGDVHIAEHLAAFGCDARLGHDEISARGTPTRGAVLDLSSQPDLAPVLAAVGAACALGAAQETHLFGLETLPGKESSRIEVLARGISALGPLVESDERSLAIRLGAPTSGELFLDPHGDHRMTFAFALLGLVRPGVCVLDPGCVAKSWPRFWDDLASLGASVERG